MLYCIAILVTTYKGRTLTMDYNFSYIGKELLVGEFQIAMTNLRPQGKVVQYIKRENLNGMRHDWSFD